MTKPKLFSSATASIVFVSLLTILSSCKSVPVSKTGDVTNTHSPQANAPTLAPIELAGSAYSVTGKPVKAIGLPIAGLARRPIPMAAGVVAYSSLKPGSARWQVYSFDFTSNTEQRRSFDAGHAEPVGWLHGRLVIASSSEQEKHPSRILDSYVAKFGTPSTTSTTPPLASSTDLFFDRERISKDPASSWLLTADLLQKQALIVTREKDSTTFRVLITQNGNHRVWIPTRPSDNTLPPVQSAAITPDGQSIIWTFTKEPLVAITTAQGKNTRPLTLKPAPAGPSVGPLLSTIDDTIVDSTGRWLIGSTASQDSGRNLIAIEIQSGCTTTLTELPGDESSPALSADGAWLFFTLKQGDLYSISRIPFESPTTGTACEQKNVANTTF
ncbi:MAG: PD40 domain-containing protein [Bdellovibrionaceae bacterium]|nr:PD40 domain-containing protein [Pseudobdellovibrionaceae bacterium]